MYGDLKSIVDVMLVMSLCTLALMHLTRVNHFIPDDWKGETQVIAERVINRNQAELSLSNEDIVYENKSALTSSQADLYYDEVAESSTCCDSFVGVLDLLI